MKNKLVLSFFTVFLLSKCEAIFVKDISNETIILLAPSNNVQIDSMNVQFNWQSISAATTYEIQIATPTFENATQIVLDSLSPNTIIYKSLATGAYQWRVKGLNSEYSTAYTTHSFTIN